MGLDMTLQKRIYIGNQYKKPEEQVIVKGVGGRIIKQEKVSSITLDVAYWRKANQIHRWFVETVQKGEDDCKEYYVTRDQIKDLVHLCKLVLASSHLVEGKVKNGKKLENGVWVDIIEDGKTIVDPVTAKSLLPTHSGFFFGSEEYDEGYYQDLKDTVEMLEAELATGETDADYYYQSSW